MKSKIPNVVQANAVQTSRDSWLTHMPEKLTNGIEAHAHENTTSGKGKVANTYMHTNTTGIK